MVFITHSAAFIFNVEGAINNRYTATLPILFSRTNIFILLFHVLLETLPPSLHKFLFPKATVYFVININSITILLG